MSFLLIHKHHFLYVTFFVLFVIIRVIYNRFIPYPNSPDEAFHFERILSTATNSRDNKLFPNNEYHYPPLYYWMGAGIVKTVGTTNITKGIVALRFTSIILSLIFSYTILRLFLLMGLPFWLSVNSFLFINLLPTIQSTFVSINPDILQNVLFTTAIYIFILDVQSKFKNKNGILAGILSGFAALTKPYALIFLPSAILYTVYLFKVKKLLHPKNTPSIIFYFFRLFFISSVILSMWIIKDFRETNNFFMTKTYFQYSVARNIPASSSINYILTVIKDTFETFFFTFGKTNNIRLPNYSFLIFISFLSLIGFIKRNKPTHHPAIAFLFIIFIMNFLVFLLLNFTMVFQPQGRYLYLSLPYIAILLISGIGAIFPIYRRNFFIFLTILFLLLYNFWGLGCLNSYLLHKENFFFTMC